MCKCNSGFRGDGRTCIGKKILLYEQYKTKHQKMSPFVANIFSRSGGFSDLPNTYTGDVEHAGKCAALLVPL